MQISVIIPTYNATGCLPKLLESLKNQTISFELIIIDSSSTDNTLEIAQKYTQNILTIPTDEFDHGGTRTKAGQIATGEIIVFLTQDTLLYDKDTLKALVDSFTDASLGAVYGKQLPYDESNIFGKHLREFNYTDTSYTRSLADKEVYGIKTAFLSDSFAAYRRSALEDINWFKDGLIVGEDSYAGAKLILKGYTLAYTADAKVYHSHSYSPIEEFKRYFDIGVFHKKEQWILDNFGKAEGEGMKYITSEFNYLLKNHAYLHIPEFFIRNGLKYIGYKLGRHYQYIPQRLFPLLSMHKNWWKTNL